MALLAASPSSTVSEDSVATQIVLTIGKKRYLLSGMAHFRVTLPISCHVPAKNHTLLLGDCPSAQNLPVLSETGFIFSGEASAHGHHFVLHSPYVNPSSVESGGKTPGFGLSSVFFSIAVALIVIANKTMRTNPNKYIFFIFPPFYVFDALTTLPQMAIPMHLGFFKHGLLEILRVCNTFTLLYVQIHFLVLTLWNINVLILHNFQSSIFRYRFTTRQPLY
jgi:hypothetical protein